MDNALLKETLVLLKMLDADEGLHNSYHYYEKLEDISQIQLLKTDKENVIRLMFSKEFDTIDWYILYVILIAKIIDVHSITDMLCAIKRKNPNLAINPEFAFVRKRLAKLIRLGVVGRLQYVQNASNSLEHAYAMVEKLAEMQKEEDKRMYQDEMAYLDEVLYGTDSSSDDDYAEYSDAYANEIRKKNALFAQTGGDGKGLFSANSKTFFGKDSQVINGYFLNDLYVQVLSSFFGTSPVAPMLTVGVKMFYEQVGILSASKVTAALYNLPSFHKTKQAFVKSKVSKFMCLSETEFKVSTPQYDDMRYFCGVFSSYLYCDTRKMLPDVEKKNMVDKVLNIKNYIGIKGINKRGKDAFVIVVVNDMADLNKFVRACISYGITEEERERLYFTGEQILNEFSVKKVLKIASIDENGKPMFMPAKLPVL